MTAMNYREERAYEQDRQRRHETDVGGHRDEVYIRETGPDEVQLTALTDRMCAVIASLEQTPEEVLIAREALQDEERRGRRKLSREMTRVLVWMGTEEPSRVRKLIDRFLPLEEAYMLRRYLLHRDPEESIGADMGITGQGVSYRLYRAIWRLRVLQDMAWDLKPEEIRAATTPPLRERDAEMLVVLWSVSFSQSRAAEELGMAPQGMQTAIGRIVTKLEGHRPAARVRKTLVEVRKRRLNIATFAPLPHAAKVPA